MRNYFMLTWIKKPKNQTTKHTKLCHGRYFPAGLPTSGSIRYVSIFLFPYLSILALSESNRNTSQERHKTHLFLFSFVQLHTTLHCMKAFMKLFPLCFIRATLPAYMYFCSDSFTLKYTAATSLFRPLILCLMF